MGKGLLCDDLRELKRAEADLHRQIETLVRRLGMIASSDVIENQKLCQTYVEMINLRTEALRNVENMLRVSVLSMSVDQPESKRA